MSSKSSKARKTVNRKAAGTTIEGKTCLMRGNREKFIADHDWAQPQMSVRVLLLAVADGAPLTGNWAIGPRNAERFGIVVEAPKKAKKAKAKKVTAVAAQVEADKPARRANGTIAPKSEWVLRRKLADSGNFTAKQIDAVLATPGVNA